MGANYGQVLAMLLGTAGVTALGGHLKANKLNDYEDTLNSNLTSQGAKPLGFKHHNFSFGDYGDMQTADQSLYKQALEAHQNNAYMQDANGHLPAGVAPMQSPAYAKEFNTGVTYPDQVDTLKRNKDYTETQDAMDWWAAKHAPVQPPADQPAMPPMFMPKSTNQNPQLNQGMTLDPGTQGQQQPLVGLGQGADGSPMLGAGAVKQEPLHIKPNEFNAMLGHDISQQGNDLKQQEFDQIKTPKAKWEARKADLDMKKTTAEIANIQQIMKFRPQEVAAKIAALSRRTGGNPSEIKMMLDAGLSPKAIGIAIYHKMNGQGPTESDSTTTDANGNVTSHTHTSRGRAGAGSSAGSPGHSVDVGGGVQIRGF